MYLEIDGFKIDGNIMTCLPGRKDVQYLLGFIKQMTEKGYIDKGSILADSELGLLCLIRLESEKMLQIIVTLKGKDITVNINNRYYSHAELSNYFQNIMRGLEEYRNKCNGVKSRDLYKKLVPHFRTCDKVNYCIFDTVTRGGSEDRWSSQGNQLYMRYVDNKLLFTLKHVDEGDSHNDTYEVTKEYLKQLSFSDLIKTCKENGVNLMNYL